MKRTIKKEASLLITFFLLSLSLVVASPVPTTVTFQGKLTNSAGVPVTGSHTVIFSLFDLSEGGGAFWQEKQIVSFTDGLYMVKLGSITPITDMDLEQRMEVYLEIQINEEIMSPRLLVTSTMFALKAEHANFAGYAEGANNAATLDGHEAAYFAEAAHDHSFSDLGGTISQDQIPPNTIHVEHAATATSAYTLDGLNSKSFALVDHTHVHSHAFSETTGIVSDEQIPNDITIDHAQNASTLGGKSPSEYVSASGDSLTGDYYTSGSLSGRTVKADRDISVGALDSTDDDILYFDGNTKRLTWDESVGQFEFSDDLRVAGTLQVDDNLTIPGGSLKLGDRTEKNLSITFLTALDGLSSEVLKWNFQTDRFELSDDLRINGSVRVFNDNLYVDKDLDVSGNGVIDNDLEVRGSLYTDTIAYRTAKTFTYNIPSISFINIGDPAYGYGTWQVTPAYRYGAGRVMMAAPVNLPAGAQITRISYFLYDNSDYDISGAGALFTRDMNDPAGELQQYPKNSNHPDWTGEVLTLENYKSEEITKISSDFSASPIRVTEDTVLTIHTELVPEFNDTTKFRFYGCQIEYTMTGVSP